MHPEEKNAKSSVPLSPLLAKRFSPRAFQADMPIEKRALLKLMEAARWAPSSGNQQPWSYIIGVKGEGDTWQKIFDCLDQGNQEWCKFAPVLMIAVAKKHGYKDQVNQYAGHDVGQANAHLTFEAMYESIYVHQMGGFRPEKVQAAFNIPFEFHPLTALALGYLGNPDMLSGKNKESELAERKRMSLDEMAFNGKWGEAFSFEGES